jgi:hypothetical protein
MERKENFEPKGAASAASKKASGRKQPGSETSASSTQGQGTSPDQGENGGDQDLLQHAKQATGEIVNQVQQKAGSTLDRQKESAATDLTQVVQAVRQFGQSLAREEGGPIARYAAEYGDKAANSLERLSTYIREQDPKQLLNDVQNFGRRRPALLLGGAFLLGFAGARLIKSSMDADSQQRSNVNTPAARPSTANVPAAAPATANVTAVRPPARPNAL